MAKWTLPVNDESWTVTVPDSKVVVLPPVAEGSKLSPREQVKAALEKPVNFEPLRRALTPDDRVCIVLDERLPYLAELIAGVLEHLVSAGIDPDAVTLLSPEPTSKQVWIDELPDELADVKAEVHHATDRKKLAYLAATKAGERIYLNRSAGEAEFVIVLCAHRHDAPGEALLVPGICDEAYQRHCETIPADIDESMWLVGTPFFVRVIEDSAGGIYEVLAGFSNSRTEADQHRDARWSSIVRVQPETVIVTVSSWRFADLSASIANAERVVAPKGKIVALLSVAPQLPEAMTAIRQASDPTGPLKALRKAHVEGWREATQWAETAAQSALFLAGPLSRDDCEELFATSIANESELQRLLDGGGRVMLLPDAHLNRIEYVAKGAAK